MIALGVRDGRAWAPACHPFPDLEESWEQAPDCWGLAVKVEVTAPAMAHWRVLSFASASSPHRIPLMDALAYRT